jgi:hypothetical protein
MVDEQIIAERIGKGPAVLDRLRVCPSPRWRWIHGFARRRPRTGAGGSLSHCDQEARLGFPR